MKIFEMFLPKSKTFCVLCSKILQPGSKVFYHITGELHIIGEKRVYYGEFYCSECMEVGK